MRQCFLVTGANSFIGSALLRRLSELEEHDIVATYRHNSDALSAHPPRAICYRSCDLAKSDEVAALFKQHKFDAVIHLAAAIPGSDETDFTPVAERDNVLAMAHLLKAAKENGCKRFVFASTIGVYDGADDGGDGFVESMKLLPSSVYGQSKLAGEKLLEAHCGKHMSGVSLRMSGVHGPGKEKGVVYAFLRAALAGKELKVSEPESRFRLLFIDDAVNALLLSLKADLPRPYCCYNVAGLEVLSLVDIANRILDVTDSKSRCNVIRNPVSRNQILDISKIQRELGFSPGKVEPRLESFRIHLER